MATTFGYDILIGVWHLAYEEYQLMIKSKRIWLAVAGILLLFISVRALVTFISPSIPEYDHQFFHKVIGEHDLWIADGYLSVLGAGVGVGDGLIHAYYPGAAPILKPRDQLWEEGRWYKNIRILFKDFSQNKSFSERETPKRQLEGRIELFKAYKVVGSSFGLLHRAQADEAEWWKDDVWVEEGKDGLNTSFINCKEKQSEKERPQCKHFFYDSNFFYQVSYDKQLLPEWKTIKDNVLALMQSFKSEEAARAFFKTQIPIAYQQQYQSQGEDEDSN